MRDEDRHVPLSTQSNAWGGLAARAEGHASAGGGHDPPVAGARPFPVPGRAPDRFIRVPMRAAVWDLGSSSFHLLVCEVGPGGTLAPHLRRRALLNLGVAVGATGSIPVDRVAAAVAATKRLRKALDPVQPDVTVALATAALRDAANGEAVVARLERAIGAKVRVLDGAEEARLCFVGQRAGVWTGERFSFGLDLGGGSLEVAVGDVHRVTLSTSVAVGAARLRGELGIGDPLTPREVAAIRARTAEALMPVRADLRAYRGVTARTVVSGGTARALARLATARARRRTSAEQGEVNQVELPAGQVEELAGRLAGLDLAQRLALPGVSARRAPGLSIGALILASTAHVLEVERFVVSEWGLREGALIDELTLQGHGSAWKAVAPTGR
jgi:exopolyphosphatase/guanosine-5'-triphosphate,3'-diphosphate pyrophosphatase